MISDRLQFWCEGMASLAVDGKPVPAETVALWADAIERMIPAIRVMEAAPVPETYRHAMRLRVVQGGAA